MTEELDVLRIIGERLKAADIPQVEFARRKAVDLAGVSTWITAREDLILSKLVWARDANSELQKRDVKTLLDDSVDWTYLRQWAPQLGVGDLLAEVTK